MKELKDVLNKETLEQVKQTASTVAEALPPEALEKITGAGNPFENIPRVPTQEIDDDLRKKG